MNDLFNNKDADFCSLIEYVDTFLNVKNKYFNLFQLPPIQRNSIWNAAQIERLWDSILRGYPIGSFLVSPRQKGNSTRDLYTGIQTESGNDGYFLLDGQQRTRALLLGFKPNENVRIWIDLNPNLTFNDIEYNDRKFLVRVLTNYQPWGMSDKNPLEKLTENQKYNARKKLNVDKLHYDYEVKINSGNSIEQNNNYSWPLNAELPVPLDLLINLCGGYSGKFNHPEWKDVLNIIPNRHIEPSLLIQEPPNYGVILEGIRQLIETTSNSIRTRSIVLLYQNLSKNEQQENVQDDMEVLFRRINAGGTVLQGEEMAYSLLKSTWDGAYEMVSSIVQNKSIGYLLSSTEIVMTATRLARCIQNKNDLPNPSIGYFRKWIGEKDEEITFLNTMKNLLSVGDNNKSKLHEIISIFCDLVVYRDINTEDIGLPKKLLLSMKHASYIPVFMWIYKNEYNKEMLENNRKNILRYLVYCFIAIDKKHMDNVSKIALELVKENKHEFFPDNQIYNKLLEKEFAVQIPNTLEFSKPFDTPVDGFLRHWDNMFNIPDDPYNSFRYKFWTVSKELLLWFQRDYASKWFKGYDPASNDAFDTPYDWDHILPYSHLITSGASPQTHCIDEDLNNKFYRNRHLYVNSIGNFRMWPFWANRSDNNQCHIYKLRMEEPNWENDLVAKELDLSNVEEFMKASVIPSSDAQIWYDAGGEVRNWPESRRIAWQNAVEKRVIFLYQFIYNTFDFSMWTNKKENI